MKINWADGLLHCCYQNTNGGRAGPEIHLDPREGEGRLPGSSDPDFYWQTRRLVYHHLHQHVQVRCSNSFRINNRELNFKSILNSAVFSFVHASSVGLKLCFYILFAFVNTLITHTFVNLKNDLEFSSSLVMNVHPFLTVLQELSDSHDDAAWI